VPTAVWVVDSSSELWVTTRLESYKVARLRADPRVTVVECDIRGVVAEGAVPVAGTAVVDTSASTRAELDALMEEKYGERFREMRAAASARPVKPESVALRITLDGAAT
jgi:PPOX class probable F420-dependent enzyme